MRAYSERTMNTAPKKGRGKTPYFCGIEGLGFVHFDD